MMEGKPIQMEKNETLENDKEKLSHLEKVKQKAEKFLRRMRQVGMVIGVGMAVNYATIHTSDVETKIENGKENFSHSDKETEHILNYLAGLDSLSNEERMQVLKVGFQLAGFNGKSIKDLSEKELAAYYVDSVAKPKSDHGETRDDFIKQTEDAFEDILPTKYEYNDTLYSALWKTEKECGSPKIRWTVGDDRNVFFSADETGVAHYNSFDHTVSINAGDFKHMRAPVTSLVAEWPHSKQFHDNYVSSSVGMVQAGYWIAKDALSTHDFVQSQLKEYATPGSLENEAHSIIELYLKKRFSFMGIYKHPEKEKKNDNH